MTLPAPIITRFRDTLQTSDHLLQPLTPANDTLLPRNLRRLAKNAFIELKSSESNHEVPYNDRIVSFLEELVPQADIRFSTYRFKLAKSDTKGLRDVNVEGGLDYAETKVYRDHRDWFERGKTVLDERTAKDLFSKVAEKEKEERQAVQLEAGPSSTSLVTAENTPPPLTASGIETSPPSLSSTGIDSDRYHHLPPGTSTSASSTSTSQPINRNLIPGSQDTSIAGFGNPSIEMSVGDSVHLPTTVIASASNEEGHFDTVLSPAVDDPFQYPAINEQSIPPPTRSRRSGKRREALMSSDSGQQSSSKRSKSSQSENFGCYLPDILGYAVIPEKCLISLPATLGISTTNPPHLPSISPTRPIVSLPLGTSSLQDNLAESRTRTASSLVKHTPSQSLDTLLAAIPVSSSSVSSSNTITTTTTTSLTSEGLPRLACPAKSRVSASASKAPLNKTSGTHTHSKTVFLTCEIKAKVEQAQEGVAREWCYLHNAHQTCGAFIGLVIIRFRLAVCLMLDERTIAMDTTDEDSWGRVEMVAEAVLRAKNYDQLPHILADETTTTTNGEPIVDSGWIKLWNTCALAASLVSDLPVNSPFRRHKVPKSGHEDDERWREVRDLVKRSREGTGTGTSSTPKPEDGSGSRSDINTQTRRSSNRPSNPSATPPGTERVDFKSTKDRMFTYARAGDSIRERRILAVHDRLEEQRRWGENGEEREGEEEEGEERQAEADYSREREGEDVEAGIGPEKISRLRGGGVGEEDLDTVRSAHSSSASASASESSYDPPPDDSSSRGTASSLESEEEASFQSTQADFAKLVDDDVWVVWVGPGMMEELMERGVRAVRRNWGLRGGGGGGGRDSKGEE